MSDEKRDEKREERVIPTVFYRDMPIAVDLAALAERAKADPADDRIPIAISSESPVERYDWWEGERYLEVLDHAPGSVDLSYAKDGLPLLLEHDRGDQHGIIEDVRVDTDRTTRGLVRFSKAQRSQEIRQDMLDGIRKKISVGYRKSDDYTQTGGENGQTPTRRYTKWTPMEASSVSIPADYNVGVGRSATQPPLAPDAPPTTPAPQARSHTVSDKNTAPAGATTDVRVLSDAESDVRAREISALASQHAMTDKLPGWIADGRSVTDVRNEIITELKARLERGPVQAPRVELTEKEQREYSFARAILQQDEGSKGFEREVSEEIARNLPAGYKPQGGFFIPTNVTMGQRAGLDSLTSTTGTELKFTKAGTFIDMLRNRARVMQAGATMLPGLDGPVTFPKQNGAGTASWLAENGGADVSESNLTLTTVSLAAKTLQSTTSFSRQLLRQAVIDVEALVRADIAAIHALAIDAAALKGTGASNQPTGVYTTSGIGVVAIGTNGGAPTYAHLVNLLALIEIANADGLGEPAVITTPGIKGTLKLTQKFASTNGDPVWGDNNVVAGAPGFSTNQVQSNLTKGSGTALHAIYAGVWSQLLIAEFGAMEVITDPYRLKKQGMIEVTSFQMIDIAVRHAGAFAVVKDAITSVS
jgi:HK97 family phage major capsid protein